MNSDVQVASGGCGSDAGFFLKQLQEAISREAGGKKLIALRLFPAANRDISSDEIARESLDMHNCFLAGDYTDVTGERL